MAAVLVRLRLLLLVRSLRSGWAKAAGMVLGAGLGLLLLALLTAAVLSITRTDGAAAQLLTVGLAATMTMAWLMGPLLLLGVDETLDPARFALLPLPARRLRPGLLAAGFLGVPAVLTALALLTAVPAWAPWGAAAGLVALVGAVLTVLTCVLAARVVTSAFAGALASRRFKDVAAVGLGLFAMLVAVGSNLLSRSAAGDPDHLGRLAERATGVLGWTPLGWAAAAPAAVAEGAWVAAGARLALAAGLVALLWWAWGRLLDRAMTTVVESGGGPATARSRWPERLFGTSPRGAVAARCLRYWRRDPRYLSSLSSIAVVPFVIVLPSLMGGSRSTVLLAPVSMALLAGPSLASDLAYDGSALWTHVSTGTPGVADRAGRLLAQMTVVGPLLVVATAAAVLVSRRPEWAVGAIALTTVTLLCGAAAGLVVGAHAPGSAPPAGASPFASTGAAGFVTVLVYAGCVLVTAVLSAPVVVPLLLRGADSVAAQVVALGAGLLYGAVVLALGIRWGGRRLEQTWPELLGRVSRSG